MWLQPHLGCQARPTQDGAEWGWKMDNNCCISIIEPLAGRDDPTEGLRKKITFQIKVNFIWKTRSQSLGDIWRSTESKLSRIRVKCFHSGVRGIRVIFWCWTTVFYSVQIQHSTCQETLESFMYLTVDKIYGDANFLLQHDLASVYRAKTTTKWFADHDVTVPGRSTRLTLSPVENLWCVRRRMRNSNTDKLKAAIKATRSSVAPQQCWSPSVPRCSDGVICADGAPNYWLHKWTYFL